MRGGLKIKLLKRFRFLLRAYRDPNFTAQTGRFIEEALRRRSSQMKSTNFNQSPNAPVNQMKILFLCQLPSKPHAF